MCPAIGRREAAVERVQFVNDVFSIPRRCFESRPELGYPAFPLASQVVMGRSYA